MNANVSCQVTSMIEGLSTLITGKRTFSKVDEVVTSESLFFKELSVTDHAHVSSFTIVDHSSMVGHITLLRKGLETDGAFERPFAVWMR